MCDLGAGKMPPDEYLENYRERERERARARERERERERNGSNQR